METITLHSRVGADGLLKLQVPVHLTNTELDVVLIVQPVAAAGQDLAGRRVSLKRWRAAGRANFSCAKIRDNMKSART